MAKLPYIPFFTGDWLKDPELSLCSPATRGVWMDLLCAMHERDRSGELSGTTEQLCRLARCQTVELTHALTELQTTGAAVVTERNKIVTVVNRRMYREKNQRLKTRDRVAKHRCNAPSSYSSSYSSSNSKPREPAARPRDGTDPDLDAMHGLPPIPPKLDTPKFRTAWQEWIQHCAQRNGHPITPLSARKLLQRFAAEMDADRATAAIDYSIGQGYAGVVEPRDSKQDRPDKRASQRMTSNVIVD